MEEDMAQHLRTQKRYAPMSREHIPGFPHKIPTDVNWFEDLPVFRDENIDNPFLHLIKFHMHVCSLKVEWHEDCLMKMFMGTLEEEAREWYENLEPRTLFSLKDFHKVFCKRYIGHCPSLSLAENCCDHSKNLIQHLVSIEEDYGNWHPEEFLEEVHNFLTQANNQDDQEELILDEIHQEIREDPKELYEKVETDNNPSALSYKIQEDIQPQDQLPQKMERNCCPIQRK